MIYGIILSYCKIPGKKINAHFLYIKIVLINTGLTYIYTRKGICRLIKPVQLNGQRGEYRNTKLLL